MILLKYENCNIFNEKSEKLDNNTNIDIEEKIHRLNEYINEYETETNYEYMECPNCKGLKLISYGCYERNIGMYNTYFKIKIKRVKCKECNHTHALLPSFILPYFQNEVSYMVVVIKEKYISNARTSEISKKYNITRQLINKWIKRFNEHLSRLKSTISSDIGVIISKLFSGIKVREKYRFINNLEFLERIPT